MNPREDTMETKTKNLREIEEVIAKAIKKVNGRKENDLCKYLPMSTGGYMHHFTLRKMKNRQPSELGSLIEKFIINTEKPSAVAPKQRAARGSPQTPRPSDFHPQSAGKNAQYCPSCRR